MRKNSSEILQIFFLYINFNSRAYSLLLKYNQPPPKKKTNSMRGFWRKKGKDEKSDQIDKKESKQDARITCFCR